MSGKAQTAALEALVEAHTAELHLPTVRRRFRALADEATREQQTPLAYLAELLEAELQERAERRERRRLLDARFRPRPRQCRTELTTSQAWHSPSRTNLADPVHDAKLPHR